MQFSKNYFLKINNFGIGSENLGVACNLVRIVSLAYVLIC